MERRDEQGQGGAEAEKRASGRDQESRAGTSHILSCYVSAARFHGLVVVT
jgi:hypothetical protein